jgi:hypothetical protein
MSPELTLPDTKLVGEAMAIACRALPEPILNHSLRAFFLASAYARAVGREHDGEGLCLAAIFHDFGLTEEHRKPGMAFTLASSAVLEGFLEQRAVPKERALPLIEAIDFHMQLLPRWSKGNVVGLLQVGAWMDVMGVRRSTIREAAAHIADQFPRKGFDGLFYRNLLSNLRGPMACFGLLFPRRRALSNARPDGHVLGFGSDVRENQVSR